MVAVALGPEIIVNGTTAGNQYRPTITKLASGGFTIAWQDESDINTDDDIRFAQFGGFGNRLTGPDDILANTATASAQFDPSIAAGNNGKFVIAWSDSSATAPDTNNRAVRFQIFNADGTESGSEKLANTTYPLSQDEPSVTVLTGGNIVVTWTAEIVTASSTTDIIRRVFDASGNPLTGEQTVNTQLVGDQDHSTVHALKTGGFAVVWNDTEDSPVTGDHTKTFVRFYNASGTAQGNPLVANEAAASDPVSEVGFAELSDGRIVFTWTEPNTAPPGDGSGSSIRFRIYSPATGTFAPVGTTANTTTNNDQKDAQIAALDNGQFVIVWTDVSTSGGDVSFAAVRMQVFNSNGTKVGPEVLVNSYTTFEQENAAITVLDDFRFVVTWQDRSQIVGDPEGYSIHARIYDARVAGITLEGTGTDNAYQGSNFGDTIEGLAGNDSLNGGGGIDFLFGGIGLDILNGGTGNDTMEGGDGNDTYYVDNASDVIVEGPGQGTADRVLTSVNYALGAAAQIELFTTTNTAGTGALNLTGNGFAQTMHGNAGANVLNGGGGVDIMTGFAGNDQYYVDVAGDIVVEGAAQGTADRVLASVSYTLGGAAQVEILSTTNTAGTGAINLTGNGFVQQVVGNAGINILNGGGGADTMTGFAGNDQYYVDNAGDVVVEAAGQGAADRVLASVSYTLGAAAQVELFTTTNTAGTGAINLTGNGFIQTMHGNAGSNVLNGGGGSDTMTGFAGADFFLFNTTLGAANIDHITDYSVAQDTIRLENAIFAGLAAGALASGAFNTGAAATEANDRIIYNAATGALLFDANGVGGAAGIQFATISAGLVLTAGDFVVI